jgi:hypothetical protein
VRKKRTRGFDLPADSLGEVESHRTSWEAQLEVFHGKQGVNSQIYSQEKIDYMISLLLNYDSLAWPVRLPTF